MKKISIILTLLATFFIGNISANAELKCVYKYNGSELVIVDGNYKSITGSYVTVKNINDKDGKMKTKCPSKLIGFALKRPNGSSEFYLYNDSSFKDDQLFKDKKQEASSTSQISIDENIVFEISSNSSIKCTYTNGIVTVVTNGGIPENNINNNSTDHNTLKKIEDMNGDLKWKCVDELKGFYISYPNGGGSSYYLYTSNSYTNLDEYKNAVNRESSTQEKVYNTVLKLTENKQYTPRTDISKNLKCTYSNGSVQIIIKDGNVTINPADNVMLYKTDDFKTNLSFCKDYIYADSYSSYPGSVNNTYALYVNNPSSPKGNVIKFTLIKNGSNGGSDDPDADPSLSSVTVSCGNGTLENLPSRLIKIINTIVRIIQIGVPVLLIIFGMIDFAKAAMAQKEDEMKKGQKTFISRLITAILVFLVIFIVKIAVRFVNENAESSKIISCVDCFISGKCD